MPEGAGTFCIVGPQPPPRHGVSAVNEAMLQGAQEAGLVTVCLNTAPGSLARSFLVRAGRIGRIGRAFLGVRRYTRQHTGPVYFSLSGGLGLVWEALLVGQARCAKVQIIVHHHSFRYLNQPYAPMRWLVRAAGRKARHIVLGSTMRQSLMQRYPEIEDIIVVGNAGFVGTPLAFEGLRPVTTPRTVGLLANLSAAKGLDDFLALAEACQARGLPWRFILAGPFEERDDRDRANHRIAQLHNFEYRGPLYNEAKAAFLDEIDIFIFPTRYRHEAEPLVLLEALRHARPVIAYARGCIAEMLGASGGHVIPAGQEFVGPTLALMEVWRGEGVAFQSRSSSAHHRFMELHNESVMALSLFFARITKSGHD